MSREELPVDGLFRTIVGARPFRLTFIVVALLLAVSVGSRLGGAAQEGGATPDASPEATPAASPVAGSATESGSVTIRVLGCDAGTTADSAGPTTCSALSGDVAIEIAGGSGDTVTVDDSLRLSAGVFRWQRLPYDTYNVTLASLPDGFTTVLAAADAHEVPEEVGDAGIAVTIAGAEPSPTITIYVIP